MLRRICPQFRGRSLRALTRWVPGSVSPPLLAARWALRSASPRAWSPDTIRGAPTALSADFPTRWCVLVGEKGGGDKV